MKVGDMVSWHHQSQPQPFWASGIIIAYHNHIGISLYTVLWDDGSVRSNIKEWQLFPLGY